MKLELQVTSLSLSKKLKELGVKQESLFRWYSGKDHLKDEHIYIRESAFDNLYQPRCLASAFTVAELGEMLPVKIKGVQRGSLHWLQIERMNNGEGWACQYYNPNFGVIHFEEEDTMANACAKMLIYLIENKLIKL